LCQTHWKAAAKIRECWRKEIGVAMARKELKRHKKRKKKHKKRRRRRR
jgi:hypothetical protein